MASTWRWAAILVATSTACADVEPEGPLDCPLVLISSQRGDLATLGEGLEAATQLALADAQSDLCLTSLDDRSQPSRAGALAGRVLTEAAPVAILAGGPSAAVSEVLSNAGQQTLPIVSCCASAPVLSDDSRVLRLAPSDALLAPALAAVASSLTPAPERIALIETEDALATAIGDRLWEQLPEAQRFARRSLREVLDLAEPADTAVLLARVDDALAQLKRWQRSEQLPDLRWIATDRQMGEDFLDAAGELAEGLRLVAPVTQGDSYEAFATRFEEETGLRASTHVARQYDATRLVLLGLEDPALPLGEAMRAASASYTGPSGAPALNAQGDVAPPMAEYRVSEGRLERVGLLAP